MRSYRFSWLLFGCLSGWLVASLYSFFADKAEPYFSGQALPSVYTPLHSAETHYSIQLVRGSEEEKSEDQKSQSSRSRRGRRRTRENRGPESERIARAFEEGNSECQSRLGLRYALSPNRRINNTLRHIEAHLRDNIRKPRHSVFYTRDGYEIHDDLVALIDHIYAHIDQGEVTILHLTRQTNYTIMKTIEYTEGGDPVEIYTLQPDNPIGVPPTGYRGGARGDGSHLYGYRLVFKDIDAKRVGAFYPF